MIIRLGIVDDHLGIRREIRNFFTKAKDIIVVGEGSDGIEAIRLAEQEKPDILLLDVELPLLRGDEVVRRLRQLEPDVSVLAISGYDDPMYILGMLENGAAGYITKEEVPDLLLGAVRSIMNDRLKWISPRVAHQITTIMLEGKSFTGRELEILRYIVLGKSYAEICLALAINKPLLKQQLFQLMEKLNVSSRKRLKEEALRLLMTRNT